MLITFDDVFEALRRGLAVPFLKRNAEELRNISELKAAIREALSSGRCLGSTSG